MLTFVNEYFFLTYGLLPFLLLKISTPDDKNWESNRPIRINNSVSHRGIPEIVAKRFKYIRCIPLTVSQRKRFHIILIKHRANNNLITNFKFYRTVTFGSRHRLKKNATKIFRSLFTYFFGFRLDILKHDTCPSFQILKIF